MAHRALQIIDSIAAEFIAADHWSDHVHKSRALSLSSEEKEIPAVLVFPRSDVAMSELGNINMAFIDSLLGLSIVAIDAADTESDLLDKLMEHRARIHISIVSDESHGLAFVSGTRYQGTDEPQIDTIGERLIGRLESRWAVQYRMNFTDPN